MLLQGPRSPFFARLAEVLTRRGARVERVLLCPGDRLFWLGRPAHRFRGSLAEWPEWLGRVLAEAGATDILGLGDGRPHHRLGFAVAREAGIRVHVLEQGYLRPGWLTLEHDSLGAWQWQGEAGPALAPAPVDWRQSFVAFAAMDVAHHLANAALGWLCYPRYRSHELWSPWREWLGWVRRGATERATRREVAAVLGGLENSKDPVFMLALQLATDFQVRDHGPTGGLQAALAQVVASFRAHAPAEARLVVKPHPLDPFPWRWRDELAGKSDGDRRVLWLPGGDLEALWPRLHGVVTVNSTVGLSALQSGVPVFALGQAVYAPLAQTGALDGFWENPPSVDGDAVADFVSALAAATQLRGSFDGDGMSPGVEGVASRLMEGRVP